MLQEMQKNIPLVRVNNKYFRNAFFLSTITEWNKLDLVIWNSISLHMFKDRLLHFVKYLKNIVYTCYNSIAIKYLTQLRLGFNHLRNHKFKHHFLDAIDLLCSYSRAIENIVHYFLHCPNFSNAQNTFQNTFKLQFLTYPILAKLKQKLFKLSFPVI